MGVAVVDMLAGTHLAQGILAAIYQKQKTGEGSLVPGEHARKYSRFSV